MTLLVKVVYKSRFKLNLMVTTIKNNILKGLQFQLPKIIKLLKLSLRFKMGLNALHKLALIRVILLLALNNKAHADFYNSYFIFIISVHFIDLIKTYSSN